MADHGEITHVARLLGDEPQWRVLVRRERPRFMGTRVTQVRYSKLDAIGQWQDPSGWLLELDDPFIADLDAAVAPHARLLPGEVTCG